MIENFLRAACGPVELGADVLRAVGTVSVVLAAIFFDLTDAAIVAFALPGLYFPRFVGMRAWADLLFAGTVLIAAWSNVFDLYTRISWWDLAVHFVCTGVVAAGAYLVLANLQIVPLLRGGRNSRTSGVILTLTIGLALSAVWEMVEWLGRAYISDEIYTAYGDTIADMALGGLGSLTAGFAIAFLPLLRTDQPGNGKVAKAS